MCESTTAIKAESMRALCVISKDKHVKADLVCAPNEGTQSVTHTQKHTHQPLFHRALIHFFAFKSKSVKAEIFIDQCGVLDNII